MSAKKRGSGSELFLGLNNGARSVFVGPSVKNCGRLISITFRLNINSLSVEKMGDTKQRGKQTYAFYLLHVAIISAIYHRIYLYMHTFAILSAVNCHKEIKAAPPDLGPE